MAVAGASRFLNAATLANLQGFSSSQPGLIESLGTVSLLDVGRGAGGDNGIGLSAQSRQLNRQFLESSTSTFNQIFSLGVAETSSIEGLQQGILALRASLPESSISPGVLLDSADDAGGDAVAASDVGAIVDEEA